MIGVYRVTYRKNNRLAHHEFKAKNWAQALKEKAWLGDFYGFQCMTLVLVRKEMA